MKKLSTSLRSSILPAIYAIIAFSCQGDEGRENSTKAQTEISPDTKTYQLVWEEEFEENTLDTTYWSYMIGNGEAYGLPGWGNNELQYYTDKVENAELKDGKLRITAQQEDYEGFKFTSARLRTKGKADWKYGKYEIKAKLPKGQGIWPAIWMLPTEEAFGKWPKSGEIDIMELLGHEPELVHGTVHYGPAWPDNKQNTNKFVLEGSDFSEDFHVFSVEWEENKIDWFVDGEKYHTVTPQSLEPENYPFNESFHMLLNLAVGGSWPGNPDETTVFPQSMEVDYIKVYQM